jgi:probable HAF family extracellular repeat protein
MKRFALYMGLAVLVYLPMSSGVAQDITAGADLDITYSFQTVNFPGDTFTQLLGVNNNKKIAGYHGSGATGHPNKGFVLTLPSTFASENFPGSTQTQVTGINNEGNTSGFYITAGLNHGFVDRSNTFTAVNFPGTTFNQLLSLNTEKQAAGFYEDSSSNAHAYTYAEAGAVFSVLTIPNASMATASGVNNTGVVCGFYVDKLGTHGFTLDLGTFTTLNFPDAPSTSALGINNNGEVVGTYTDTTGLVHGFVYESGSFEEVDDPDGVGATMINGVNDNGVIVGFYGTCATGGTICHGFVGTP